MHINDGAAVLWGSDCLTPPHIPLRCSPRPWWGSDRLTPPPHPSEVLAKTLVGQRSLGPVELACDEKHSKKSQLGRWVHEVVDTVTIYGGYPGSDGGHVVEASSYFDRFWDKGQKSRRYFLIVKKCTS